MPISPIARVVSDTTTFVRSTRAAAVAAALAGDPPNSVVYGNVLNLWPELETYVQPNNGSFPAVPDPGFVWDSTNFVPGERLGFATVINNVPHNTNLVLFLMALADNAHTAHVEVYKNGALTQVISGELTDGNMDPSTQESPPYNWQKVRFYTKNFVTNNTPAEPLQLVISFEVQNYFNQGNTDATNPGILMFAADLYRET